MTSSRMSNLDLVKLCDSAYSGLPYADESTPDLARDLLFSIKNCSVGLICLKVARRFWTEGLLDKSAWQLQGSTDSKSWTTLELKDLESDLRSWPLLRLEFTMETREERSKIMADILKTAKDRKAFAALTAWRDELYGIYGPAQEVLCAIERGASGLFGIQTYGVHMNVFTRDKDGNLYMWVPRRSNKKAVAPGMLDNSVAGGISLGEEPFESIVREAFEEASLPEDLVRSKAKAVGTVSYHFQQYKPPVIADGVTHQPETQFVYDLEVDKTVILKPEDGEVESFKLMDMEEFQNRMAQGEFKPNTAVVALDFLIRHGIVDEKNEPDYEEIVRRIHRKLPFPSR